MNVELTKLLAERSSNPAALEQLRTHFAPQPRRRHDDRPALYTLATTGFLFLVLAALTWWAEDDLNAWRTSARATPPAVAAAQCPR
jgi:hypothetical protein